MSLPKQGEPGFLTPAPGQDPYVVRALVPEDFFPTRELHFTPRTGELLKIEGKRRGHRDVNLTRQLCIKDLQLVVDTLRDKYSSLEVIPAAAKDDYHAQLCEGSRRLPGNPNSIGVGRCIHLECTSSVDEKATLTITYWNVDIYARAQREEQESREETQKRLGSERGLDPSRL